MADGIYNFDDAMYTYMLCWSWDWLPLAAWSATGRKVNAPKWRAMVRATQINHLSKRRIVAALVDILHMVYWYYIFGNISILVNKSRQQSILWFYNYILYSNIRTVNTYSMLTKSTVYMTCTDLNSSCLKTGSPNIANLVKSKWT